MKSEQQIKKLLGLSNKAIEEEIGIKIRNGQSKEGIKNALEWVLR